MKKIISLLLAVLLLVTFGVFALGSGESEGTVDQGSGATDGKVNNEALGDYSVIIDSCRLAEDFEGDPVIIVKYKFTNNQNDEATSFMVAFDDKAYQNGVGLNHAYVLKDSAKYSEDNQTKAIKKGATIDVEVAYELNDTETDVEIEVKELFSFSDKTLTKTFSIK